MHLCASVSEKGGDGEGAGSEASFLLSYTLRYVSLSELGTLCHSLGCENRCTCAPGHLCIGFTGIVYYKSRKRELQTGLMNESVR